MNDRLYLKQLEVGPMQNFVYLIGDRQKHECVMVDPAWNVPEVLEEAKKDDMNVTGALVTHAHFDHVNGLDEFLEKVKGKIYCNKDEAEFLKFWSDDLKPVSDGDKLQIGDTEITFLHTPGHTPGSQCFFLKGGARHAVPLLISGDTLFIQACGRCDMPGGDAEQMYYSLKRLGGLEEKTVLYPGHNYSGEPTSTIGQERAWNPYLKTPDLQDFLAFRMGKK